MPDLIGYDLPVISGTLGKHVNEGSVFRVVVASCHRRDDMVEAVQGVLALALPVRVAWARRAQELADMFREGGRGTPDNCLARGASVFVHGWKTRGA